MKVAKQNILTTAPTPKYAVNADLDAKIVYLGLDVEPATVEPGKASSSSITGEGRGRAGPTAGMPVHAPHVGGRGNQGYINAEPHAVRASTPRGLEGGRHRPRRAHRAPAPDLGLRRAERLVGFWRGAARMTVKTGAHDPEGRVLAAANPRQGGAQGPGAQELRARKVAKGPSWTASWMTPCGPRRPRRARSPTR